MKFFAFIIVVMSLSTSVFSTIAHASQTTLSGKKIQIRYDGNQTYNLEFSSTTVTWSGVEGTDLGRSETDPCAFTKINKTEFLVSWMEKDRSIIALVLNFTKNQAFAIGHEAGQMWQRKGQILKL